MTKKQKGKSSSVPIEEFAGSSSANFHTRVIKRFRDLGWHALVSPYYLDGSTNLPREIDLMAEKEWEFYSRSSGPQKISIKLFVECKYTNKRTVFWFDVKDVDAAERWLETNTPLPARNSITARHHYLDSGANVAKLFQTDGAGPEAHQDPIYKALNQSLHSMVYLRHQGSSLPAARDDDLPRAIVELPVVVVSSFSEFYRVDIRGDGAVEPLPGPSFQLEVNYAYKDPRGKNKSEYFLVDVVEAKRLDEFVAMLERDAKAIEEILY